MGWQLYFVWSQRNPQILIDAIGMKFDQSILQHGDCLLYFEWQSLVDWAIAIKTGYRIAHCEVYAGRGMSFASRNGIGVNRYRFRPDGLVCVRRPIRAFDFDAGEKWFDRMRGQKYDFLGLLCFYLAVKRGSKDRMFCSEFALRLYRSMQFNPVNPNIDADRMPPCLFWEIQELETVWEKKGFKF